MLGFTLVVFARSIDDLLTRYHSLRFLKDPSTHHLEYAFFYTDYFEQWSFLIHTLDIMVTIKHISGL